MFFMTIGSFINFGRVLQAAAASSPLGEVLGSTPPNRTMAIVGL